MKAQEALQEKQLQLKESNRQKNTMIQALLNSGISMDAINDMLK